MRTYPAVKFAVFIYFLLLNIVPGGKVYAQNTDYIFRHISTENGLVNNYVKKILQDSYGYIWIGTQGGLQRYDGYRFVTYVADFHNPDALQTDWISTLFEDSRHRFWVGTDKGSAYTLNRNTGKFYNYNLHASGEKNFIKNAWQFCEDGRGDVWVAASSGLFKLNQQTNKFENMNAVLGMGSNDAASSITTDSDGNIWLSTTTGVKFYDVIKHVVYDRNNNPRHLPVLNIKEPVSNVFFDDVHNVWVSTGYNHILYRYNYDMKAFRSYFFGMPLRKSYFAPAPNNVVGTMYETRDKKFYVGLIPLGVALYNNTKDTFDIIEADNENPYGMHLNAESYSSVSITDDNQDNTWIGTNRGINICNPQKNVFSNYGAVNSGNSSKNLSLPVNSFLQTPSDGDIYVPYYYPGGGINRYDSNLIFKQHYVLVTGSADNDKNQVWCLYQDSNGIIWAPNQDGSILKLNPKTGVLKIEHDTALTGNINTIKRDNEGNVWIAHWSKGLMKIDHSTGKYITYPKQPVKNISCILFDGDNIWVGGRDGGLWLFNKTKGIFTHGYTYNQQIVTSISNNNISDVIAYNKDTLIVATLSGINIFDKRTETFSVISSKDGLPDNLILAVTLDRKKDVWATCVSGLCKVNIYTRIVTRYDATDGVMDPEFSGWFLALKNGKLLVAGSKGFIAFNPADIPFKKPPPDVSITGFWVFDKKLSMDPLSRGNTIELSYTENSIRIEFSSLQFNSPGKIKYEYRLDGADRGWISAGREQAANYNQLQSGHYTFNIRSANREGKYSVNITRLSIYIVPPFWRRWWFLILTCLCLVSLIFWVIKWREQNIRAIENSKTKVQELTAEQYKNQLELEQISNFFSKSVINNYNIDDVLWDVAKKLIGRLGFVDCMIYLWNDDKTRLIQKAGYGPKGSLEEIQKLPFDVVPGQGVVGYVAQKGEAVIIPDTTVDARYRVDEMQRMSEICVPIKYNEELVGVIDSEHYDKGFFTKRHLQILTAIAGLIAGKIKSIESEQALRQRKEELDNIQQQLAQVQLSALRSQMNPHFIFNSLNSINTFILQNDQDNASEYLNKFSRLMRMILDNSRNEWILLENELTALELYIQLEALRFNNSFTYSINVSEDISTAGILVPPLIIQPYVENAIWHGLMHRTDPGGKLLVHVFKEKELVHIEIEDNGVGMEASAILKRKKNQLHKSHGMKITAERLAVVNDVYKLNASVTITNLKNLPCATNGTRVLITLQHKSYESNIGG